MSNYKALKAAVAQDSANNLTNRSADVSTALDQGGNTALYEQAGAAPPGAAPGGFGSGFSLFHGLTTSVVVIVFLFLAYLLYKGELRIRVGGKIGPAEAGAALG